MHLPKLSSFQAGRHENPPCFLRQREATKADHWRKFWAAVSIDKFCSFLTMSCTVCIYYRTCCIEPCHTTSSYEGHNWRTSISSISEQISMNSGHLCVDFILHCHDSECPQACQRWRMVQQDPRVDQELSTLPIFKQQPDSAWLIKGDFSNKMSRFLRSVLTVAKIC